MFPYFLLLFVSTVFPLLFYKTKRGILVFGDNRIAPQRNKITILFFFVGLFILLALRDITVGTDLIEYKAIFELCDRASFEELTNFRWELGYTVYNKLFAFVSKNYRFFLIVTAAITLIPIYKLYSKETKYSFLLIVLFINMPCFLMIFSGLRQAIAISIGVFVFMALEKKKYILSALLILFASWFHVSAWVLLLLYPAFFAKIKVKHLLFVLPSVFAIYIFRIPLLATLITLMPDQYIDYYGEIEETGAIGMMILFLIFSTFAFVVLDEAYMTKRDYFLRNILLIATILQFFVPIHGLVQRMSYYFLIFVPVAIISIVQTPRKMMKNVSDVAVIVMSCFFVLYFFYNGMFSTDNLLDVFPYKFFWSGNQW